MAGSARQHHYIPQVYLRGFAVPGTGKHPQITVHKLKHGTSFATNPRNIAGRRDFNRVHVEGLEPNAVEEAYNDLETDFADAVVAIRTSGEFTGRARDVVFHLMSLLAVRSPQMREHWRAAHEQLARRMMDVALSSRDLWKSQMAELEKEHPGISGRSDYDQMKDFIERGDYSVQLDRTYQIGQELDMMRAVLPHLVDRNWVMTVADDTVGEYVTSDRPVLLHYTFPRNVRALYRHSPGFGVRDTQVIFPIDRRHLIVGEFDGDEGVYPATREWLGVVNTAIAAAAYEEVYAAGRKVTYRAPDGQTYCDAQMSSRFRTG